MTHTPQRQLNDGYMMPVLGYGTWQAKSGAQAEQAVSDALAAGYRLIDTAAAYGNEASIGRGIAASDVVRDDIFVTTKLWNANQGYRGTIKAFHKSRKRLSLDYIDLYLIHWPLHNQAKIRSTWRAFEKLQRQGYIRSIGVSNFNEKQLSALMATSNTAPAVNQVEVHPAFPQTKLRAFCTEHDIAVESWGPLGGGAGGLLANPVIQSIADKHGKQPAQIILRWHVQNNLIAIPKSTHAERMAANIDVFDFTLDGSDIIAIKALESDVRVGADPANIATTVPTWLVQLAHRFGLVHWQK